jgi:hypothetical protein
MLLSTWDWYKRINGGDSPLSQVSCTASILKSVLPLVDGLQATQDPPKGVQKNLDAHNEPWQGVVEHIDLQPNQDDRRHLGDQRRTCLAEFDIADSGIGEGTWDSRLWMDL